MNSCLVFRPQNPTSLIYPRFTTLTPSSFPHTNTIMYRTPFTSPCHSHGYDYTRLFFRSLASAKWWLPSNLFSSTELSQQLHTLRYPYFPMLPRLFLATLWRRLSFVASAFVLACFLVSLWFDSPLSWAFFPWHQYKSQVTKKKKSTNFKNFFWLIFTIYKTTRARLNPYNITN